MKPKSVTSAALRFGRWLAVACMVVSPPLQAVSALVAAGLGPKHSHTSFAPAEAVEAQDPMAGWRDFRRTQHGNGIAAVLEADAAHTHVHEIGIRHHHNPADQSVVKEDAFEDSLPAEVAQTTALFVFMVADGAARIPAPAEAFGAGWRTFAQLPMPDPCRLRIERPPHRV